MLTFPRHVHQRGGVYRIVTNEPDYHAAQAQGWVDHPRADWPVPMVYTEWQTGMTVPEPEASDVARPVAPPVSRNPRGRPRKALLAPEDQT